MGDQRPRSLGAYIPRYSDAILTALNTRGGKFETAADFNLHARHFADYLDNFKAQKDNVQTEPVDALVQWIFNRKDGEVMTERSWWRLKEAMGKADSKIAKDEADGKHPVRTVALADFVGWCMRPGQQD